MGIYSNTSSLLETMGSLYVVEYDSTTYKNTNKACKAIEAQLESMGYDVKYVEPNYIVTALDMEITPQYTLNSNQAWNYNMIKAPQAWEITIGSSNVRVAVIDTGIDLDHPNLQNFIDTLNAKTYAGTTSDDDNGHGTHVAGIIASYGSVSGVMRVAKLIPVKVLDANGSGSTTNVMNGIIWAADHNADVINLSLGGGSYSTAMQDACTYAYNNGTVVVAATGNDGTSPASYPARYNNVIGVGAVTSTRARASYSNYGTGLDVMAPGSSIYSTYMGGGYATLSGTSMATPHVAGLAGLLKAANPNASVQAIMDAICDTAVLDSGRSSTYYGYGIIDCYAAVLQIQY
jgi:subtilisin family serine protease